MDKDKNYQGTEQVNNIAVCRNAQTLGSNCDPRPLAHSGSLNSNELATGQSGS